MSVDIDSEQAMLLQPFAPDIPTSVPDLTPGLAKQASQITMYDVKSYYNSAKNMVLNVPEMEAKVREATNEDAWWV
jgi:epsin